MICCLKPGPSWWHSRTFRLEHLGIQISSVEELSVYIICSVCTHMCSCTSMDMYVNARDQQWVSVSITFYLFFLRQVSHLKLTDWLNSQASEPTSFSSSHPIYLSLPTKVLGLQMYATTPRFSVGAEGLNPGPCDCTASTNLVAIPQPLNPFYFYVHFSLQFMH